VLFRSRRVFSQLVSDGIEKDLRAAEPQFAAEADAGGSQRARGSGQQEK
jgi:hypothetical protein